MREETNSLGYEPVGKLLGTFAVPSIISMVVSTLYNIVDQIFIGRGVGYLGNGATDATMTYSLEYGCIIAAGFPFYMFSMGFNSIVRADGSPVYAMLSTLSGAILNTILDPIFIFIFHMGVGGAAIATVLGQIISCIMTLLYLRKFRCITLTRDCLLPRWKLCGKVCSLGISSFFLQLAATIVITVMNMEKKQPQRQGSDIIFLWRFFLWHTDWISLPSEI